MQETVGYFFCLQDRALLCRKCDVAIHTANSYVSSHQRFLLTGVKVGIEATEPCISSSTKEMLNSSEPASSQSIPRSATDPYSTGEIKDTFRTQIGGIGTLVSDKVPLNRSTTTSAGTISGWHLGEYLRSTNPNQNYGALDTMPSKVYGSYCV